MPDSAAALRARNLRTLALLAGLFLLPLLLAFCTYYGSGWRPGNHVNHGVLITPPRPLPAVRLPQVLPPAGGALPALFRGQWSLVYVGAGSCDAACAQALFVMASARLALNNELTRVRPVFLVSADCCAQARLAHDYPALVVLDAQGAAAAALLAQFPDGRAGAHAVRGRSARQPDDELRCAAELARVARGPAEAAAAFAHRLDRREGGSAPTMSAARWMRRLAIAGVHPVLHRGRAGRLRAPDRRGPWLPGLARLLRSAHPERLPPAARSAQAAYASRPLEVGKAWREMIHRYAVGTLSLLILVLAVLALRARRARLVSVPLVLALLATLIVQALLGMLTVTWRLNPLIVTLHLLFGLTTLALLWWLTLGLSQPATSWGASAMRGPGPQHQRRAVRSPT